METEADIISRNPEMANLLVTPENARAHLEYLGYTEDMWDRIMDEKFGSHNVRAYISIVRGGVPRLEGLVYQEERLKDSLTPTRQLPEIK